jgi:hypothetical protein
MRIADLARQERLATLSPLKRRVLQHLETHSDEVFPTRDEDLAKRLDVKPAALDWTLWWLAKNDYISKERVGRVYFGSSKAVNDLRRQLETARAGRRKGLHAIS